MKSEQKLDIKKMQTLINDKKDYIKEEDVKAGTLLAIVIEYSDCTRKMIEEVDMDTILMAQSIVSSIDPYDQENCELDIPISLKGMNSAENFKSMVSSMKKSKQATSKDLF